MNADGELDRFQRWLQSRLADAENIESDEVRIRTSNRIQNAIQECINYKQAVTVQQSVANPFVMRDLPVRSVNESEVKAVSSLTGVCTNCEADLSGDLEFCPLCGEFQ
tara:strand:+ start:153 stop:476 length:324 start_codon:yes stop_codon:yes gene_type:complete